MNIKNPFAIYKGLPKSIYIIFVSRIIDNMGSVVMPMITLILTQKIGFSKSETGIVATIFMIMQAPFLLLGGKLVDKMGSKKVIVLFNTLGAITYIPCGFMKPHIAMAIMIALAANFFSVAAPAYNAIVTEVAPQQKIKSAYSILYLGYNLGLAIGPALAGILFNSHLQLLFIIDAVTCVASTSLLYFFVPDKKVDAKPLKDKEADLNIKNSFLKLFYTSPVLIIFSVVLLAYNFCYSQWGFMLPLQVAHIFKSSGAQYYSLLVSANAVAVIVLTPVLTSLTHRFRPLAIIAAGGVFYMAAFVMFGAWHELYAFFIAAIILTAGQILININTNIFIALKTPQEYIGRANSILTIINGVGVAVGPVIMGQILLKASFRAAWLGVAIIMFIGAVSMFLLNLKSRKESEEQNCANGL